LEPTQRQLLELDIDIRLADLWQEVGRVEVWNIDLVSSFIRAAYGKGYCDAFLEKEDGSLYVDNGYRLPS
jgi:hypothetical protein